MLTILLTEMQKTIISDFTVKHFSVNVRTNIERQIYATNAIWFGFSKRLLEKLKWHLRHKL